MPEKKKKINSVFVCKQDWGHAEIKHSLIITVLNVWVHTVFQFSSETFIYRRLFRLFPLCVSGEK